MFNCACAFEAVARPDGLEDLATHNQVRAAIRLGDSQAGMHTVQHAQQSATRHTSQIKDNRLRETCFRRTTIFLMRRGFFCAGGVAAMAKYCDDEAPDR